MVRLALCAPCHDDKQDNNKQRGRNKLSSLIHKHLRQSPKKIKEEEYLIHNHDCSTRHNKCNRLVTL